MQDTVQVSSAARRDRQGKELDDRRFQLFREISSELSLVVAFPTSFDLLVKLRGLLQDSSQTLEQLSAIISLEPLLSLRILQLANARKTGRKPITLNVHQAIQQLGLPMARRLSLSVTAKQLEAAKRMVVYGDVASKLWKHSLRAACGAFMIAKRMTNLDPDAAMLAGWVHDLGAFYLLQRFTQDEELVIRPVSAKYLAARWHENIGHALLTILEAPGDIANTALDHDQPRPLPGKPTSLGDVVYLANVLDPSKSDWLHPKDLSEAEQAISQRIQAEYPGLTDDIDRLVEEAEQRLRG